MGDSVSRMIIKTMVRRAIRDMKESPERNIRNLIDLAAQFAGTKFQKEFFQTVQNMLTNEDSAYYTLARNVVASVEDERILTFGMNLGYNSCLQGAELIVEKEAALNCHIPWSITLEFSRTSFQECRDIYHHQISEGESLGIFTWFLFPSTDPLPCLELASEHTDSSFILFCPGKAINEALLQQFQNVKNIMFAVSYDEDAASACTHLKKAGFLYSVYHIYTNENYTYILDGTIFKKMEALTPSFAVLQPHPKCHLSVKKQVYDQIKAARLQQNYAMILWEYYEDVLLVDSIISGDAHWVGFDSFGELHRRDMFMPVYGSNFFDASLTSILRRTFYRT